MKHFHSLFSEDNSDNDEEGTVFPPQKHLKELLQKFKFEIGSQTDFDERPHDIIEIFKSLLKLGGFGFININIENPNEVKLIWNNTHLLL